jgi:RNA polymerase sigma-70 factor (ECF subfamily)
MADQVGAAMLVVLERLAPAERLAFVLHDMFAVPFDDIAPIIGRSTEAVRQLASRARRRVQGSEPPVAADRTHQRKIVHAFLAAAKGGDFEGLLAVLDPDVVFRSDAAGVQLGALAEVRGAAAVADIFKGRAQGAKAAMVDGELGLVVAFHGVLRVVLRLTFDNERINAINAVADPERLGETDYAILASD